KHQRTSMSILQWRIWKVFSKINLLIIPVIAPILLVPWFRCEMQRDSPTRRKTYASDEITRNIAGVEQASKQTAEGATHAETASVKMNELARALASLVTQFRVLA
ncbi:MAG: hypothetical protein ABGX07_14690, partial [Pirellulaceae bacterium]